MPLDGIVAELNLIRPNALGAYSSIAHALALEALAGRLHIEPVGVTTTAEPLLPEARDAIREAWGVDALNVYGTSEVSVVAQGCGQSPAMHLNEDAVIVEVEDGRILVTSLINRTLPLIRYEMTDEVTLVGEPCPCGSPFRLVADVHGRADDWFEYASGARVHPHGIRSVLTKTPDINEYQVRQTVQGVDVDVRVAGHLDTSDLARRITASLEQSGVDHPVVRVRVVDEIARVGIGKLKRFVPLH
jgi:phenylacetate-coenzyme A ligase PaaK-like adenylate-forming protein